jgi:hypothetical protein
MSDEQRKDAEVEGHVKHPVTAEPVAEGDDDEVEAHVKKASPRKSMPRKA